MDDTQFESPEEMEQVSRIHPHIERLLWLGKHRIEVVQEEQAGESLESPQGYKITIEELQKQLDEAKQIFPDGVPEIRWGPRNEPNRAKPRSERVKHSRQRYFRAREYYDRYRLNVFAERHLQEMLGKIALHISELQEYRNRPSSQPIDSSAVLRHLEHIVQELRDIQNDHIVYPPLDTIKSIWSARPQPSIAEIRKARENPILSESNDPRQGQLFPFAIPLGRFRHILPKEIIPVGQELSKLYDKEGIVVGEEYSAIVRQGLRKVRKFNQDERGKNTFLRELKQEHDAHPLHAVEAFSGIDDPAIVYCYVTPRGFENTPSDQIPSNVSRNKPKLHMITQHQAPDIFWDWLSNSKPFCSGIELPGFESVAQDELEGIPSKNTETRPVLISEPLGSLPPKN